jgi:translation initiation factor 3 subunit L
MTYISLVLASRERNIKEIHTMYEHSFAKLSERFFKGTTWPPVEYIADLVDKDSVFCLLYKVSISDVSSACL